jgi:hypothetical protein
MMRLNPVASVEDTLKQVAKSRAIVVVLGVPTHHPVETIRLAGADS